MSTQTANEARPALLFVPDISGFTQFVQSTEISHSQHIIAELLEKLIESNGIGLEVSEVEGDAILFYRFGEPPTAEEFFEQVRQAFIAFHSHLRLYETQRICQCGACVSAQNLTLKIVAHYGPVAQTRVKDHVKLFGQDVIAVHRLLKNDVPDHEYALFTNALSKAWPAAACPEWSAREPGSADYDVGRVQYCHSSLAPLRQDVPEPESQDYSIPGAKHALFSVEQTIAAPMDLVFAAMTDLPARMNWMEGVKRVEMHDPDLNRLGTKHRCVIDRTSPIMVTSGSHHGDDTITVSETDAGKVVCTVATIRRQTDGGTHLVIDGFVKDAFPFRLLFTTLFRRKLTRLYEASSVNLKRYCEELRGGI